MGIIAASIFICLFVDYRLVQHHKLVMKRLDFIESKVKENQNANM